jgi:hypothetical protein
MPLNTSTNKASATYLVELVHRASPEAIANPSRCRALVLDYCGTDVRECAALYNSADEGIPAELMRGSGGVPFDAWSHNLAQRLVNRRAMSADLAEWAVNSWAVALGIPGWIEPWHWPSPEDRKWWNELSRDVDRGGSSETIDKLVAEARTALANSQPFNAVIKQLQQLGLRPSAAVNVVVKAKGENAKEEWHRLSEIAGRDLDAGRETPGVLRLRKFAQKLRSDDVVTPEQLELTLIAYGISPQVAARLLADPKIIRKIRTHGITTAGCGLMVLALDAFMIWGVVSGNVKASVGISVSILFGLPVAIGMLVRGFSAALRPDRRATRSKPAVTSE